MSAFDWHQLHQWEERLDDYADFRPAVVKEYAVAALPSFALTPEQTAKTLGSHVNTKQSFDALFRATIAFVEFERGVEYTLNSLQHAWAHLSRKTVSEMRRQKCTEANDQFDCYRGHTKI